MAKRGLGKGLDALIPGNFQPTHPHAAQQVPIQSIAPNPSQPRSTINNEGLEELANSIREHGILQPLILTQFGNDDQYTLVAGERRLRAAELAGLESVPAIIREVNEQEQLEIALIENIQRENLTPLESAFAFQKLSDEFNLSHEQISTRVGKSRTAVTNTLRLLKLPEEIQVCLQSKEISEGHARALLGLSSKNAQVALLQTILKNGLNVRQTEDLVRKFSGRKTTKSKAKKEISPELKMLEDQLRLLLGTKVTLKHGEKGGSVVIHYYSDEELNALINRLKNN